MKEKKYKPMIELIGELDKNLGLAVLSPKLGRPRKYKTSGSRRTI